MSILTRHALTTFVVAGAIALAVATALAQSFDGKWVGTLSCDKLAITKGPLRTSMEVTVSAGTASYSRTVYNEEGTTVVGTESGGGPVAADGAITLSGNWKAGQRSFTYSASYAGTMSGDEARLRGSQSWNYGGRNEHRPCSIYLKRAPAS